MLVISSFFTILSLLSLGEVVVEAKSHNSPLGRKVSQHPHRRHVDIRNPLVARKNDDDNVVWVDVTSTKTLTASATQASAASISVSNDPPPLVGAVLAGQEGDSSPDSKFNSNSDNNNNNDNNSNENDENIVWVDVTSTITETVHITPMASSSSSSASEQQQEQTSSSSEEKEVPKTTITGTRTKAIPTVGAVAISTGKGGKTSIIQDTSTQSAVAQSTATASSDKPINGANEQAQKPWVDLHNAARAKYQVGPVSWRQDLVAIAKEHAQACNKAHTKAAENLQWGSGMGTPKSAVDAWMEEDALYKWDNPVYSDATGHFTQVVWKNTSFIGCWIAECDPQKIAPGHTQSFQSACEYDPAGNFVGAESFRANVLTKGS
ncbi:uncharacterized protein L201_006317 [Kwoniella dendrophila CBS 6074]|uniref:SCP domain-containing protein n=1 Tax=Kwoniella dendrophila CBS 6074 TaxID=1295534 RepID=A0AAX4K2N9_9TREE